MNIPYELLEKYCKGECTEEENAEVDEWLQEDEAHIGILLDLKAEWIYLDQSEMVIPDKHLVWQRIKKQSFEQNEDEQKPIHEIYEKNKTKHVNRAAYKWSAVLLLFAVANIGFWWLMADNADAVAVAPITYTTIETSEGDKSKVLLADGSVVWLNSESKVTFSSQFDQQERNIEVDGELYLDVKKSAKKFIVSINQIKIEVLGTSFNILAYRGSGEINIALQEGKISVLKTSDNSHLFNLLPSQQATIRLNDLSYQVVNSMQPDVNIWTQEHLTIYNATIDEVIQKLEHWYGVQITYSQLNTTKRYSFLLKKESLVEFFELFNKITPIQYTIHGKEVVVRGK